MKQLYYGLVPLALGMAIHVPAAAQLRSAPITQPQKPVAPPAAAPNLTSGINRADDKPPPKEPEPKPTPKDMKELRGASAGAAARRLTSGANRAEILTGPKGGSGPKPGPKDAASLRRTPVTQGAAPNLTTSVNQADKLPHKDPGPKPKNMQDRFSNEEDGPQPQAIPRPPGA